MARPPGPGWRSRDDARSCVSVGPAPRAAVPSKGDSIGRCWPSTRVYGRGVVASYSYLRALRERDIKSRDPDRTRGPERAPASGACGWPPDAGIKHAFCLKSSQLHMCCQPVVQSVKSAPYVLPAGCPITRFGDISFDCVLSPQQVRRTSALRIGSCSRAGYII